MSIVIKKKNQEYHVLEMKRGQSFKVKENRLHQVLMVTLKKQRIRGAVALRLRGGTQWAP